MPIASRAAAREMPVAGFSHSRGRRVGGELVTEALQSNMKNNSAPTSPCAPAALLANPLNAGFCHGLARELSGTGSRV